ADGAGGVLGRLRPLRKPPDLDRVAQHARGLHEALEGSAHGREDSAGARSSPTRSTRDSTTTPSTPTSERPHSTTTGTPTSRAARITPPATLPRSDCASNDPSPVITRSAASI